MPKPEQTEVKDELAKLFIQDSKMPQGTTNSIIGAVDSLVDNGSKKPVDARAAAELYVSAYSNIPAGGFPHRAHQHVDYLDGSYVHETTIDGKSFIDVKEVNVDAQCKDKKDKYNQPDLQETYECMRGPHGGSIAEDSSFDNGAGFKRTSNRTDAVLLNKNWGQKDYSSNSIMQPGPELSLVDNLTNHHETVSINHKLPDGSIKRAEFARDRDGVPTLHALEIVEAGGKKHTKVLDLNLGTEYNQIPRDLRFTKRL